MTPAPLPSGGEGGSKRHAVTSRTDGTAVGIVLAGGLGRRFGRPKADVVLDDDPRSLTRRAVDGLRAHGGCDTVLVVAQPTTPLPPDLSDLSDVEVVHDTGDGPLAALVTAWPVDADVVVLACDLPHAGPALAVLPAPGPSVAVDDAGRVQPLCARYPASVRAAAIELTAAGERRMTAFATAAAAAPIPVDAATLRNLNEA